MLTLKTDIKGSVHALTVEHRHSVLISQYGYSSEKIFLAAGITDQLIELSEKTVNLNAITFFARLK